MKTKKMKVIALLLAIMLIGTACGQTGTSNVQSGNEKSSVESQGSTSEKEGQSSEEQEIVTLSILMGANDIDTTPWYQEYMEENLGIHLEYVLTGSGVLDALMASNDLPDIVMIANNTKINTAVQSGMLVNLEEYKDQLPDIFDNEVYAAGIEYSRDTLSNNTGGVYALPNLVGKDERVGGDPMIRWDLYKELGYPEVNNWDELLDMLKKMQEMYPTTEDGLKTYGLSLFKNWDSGFVYPAWGYYGYFEGYNKDVNALMEIMSDGSGVLRSKLDDDSNYKEALQFFFKANQMGLLDPDSATQTYDNATVKVNNGQVLFTPKISGNGYNTDEHVNAEDWSGYAQWWPDFMTQTYNGDNPVGNPGTYKMAISTNCENIDKALEFVNWYYSYEGVELWWNGPEGVLWEEENGKKVPTDTYYTEGGVSYEFPQGGSVLSQQMLNITVPLAPGVRNPETDQEVNIWLSDVMEPVDSNKVMDDWSAHYGDYVDALAMWKAEDKNLIYKSPAMGFLPSRTDEDKELTNLIGPIVIEASWKMIFAKDQAEFDALWEKLQADAKAAGIDRLYEIVQARWKDAQTAVSKYTK